jgi:hypothetical protein
VKKLVVLALAASLAGCATQQSLYSWGNYDQMLFQTYKDPSKAEEMRTSLEAHIAAADQAGQRVAPGIYAEVGTLYLQTGATDKAVSYYKRERETWPESKGLMDALISNLERSRSAQETKQ